MLVRRPIRRLALTLALLYAMPAVTAHAQGYGRPNDAYRPPEGSYGSTLSPPGGAPADPYGPPNGGRPNDVYRPGPGAPREVYVPPAPGGGGAQVYGSQPQYGAEPPGGYRRDGYAYGQPPPGAEPYDPNYGGPSQPYYAEPGPGPGYDHRDDRTYSRNEILGTGHRFFGSVSRGLADIVEYAFQKAGRPNGYILGEDAGGAFIAGLRYGEGTLYTKNAGVHKVYWQGPSVGYDFGGEGSKTMVLVYNLRDPFEIYDRFPGVQGSAYIVGGVGIQFQQSGDVVLAPIRSGVGLRLGANIGYLKYTREPTWNPF